MKAAKCMAPAYDRVRSFARSLSLRLAWLSSMTRDFRMLRFETPPALVGYAKDKTRRDASDDTRVTRS